MKEGMQRKECELKMGLRVLQKLLEREGEGEREREREKCVKDSELKTED